MSAEQQYLTSAELAERWRLSNQTLANWRHAGKGPPFIRIGSRILYPQDAVRSFEKLSQQWLSDNQPLSQNQ
jgi:predicted site-specific integrase-resolvase